MGARNLFIVIEGIDGVGKTTCAKLLAEKVNATYYKTPAGIFEKMRNEIEKINDHQIRFLFYLISGINASKKICRIMDESSIVCDRYVYSTIAYHKALGVNFSFINLDRLPIILPDYAFYLFAENSICEQRMAKRGILTSSDSKIEKNRNLQNKIHHEFRKLPLISIDTSALNPDEVCQQILSRIYEH